MYNPGFSIFKLSSGIEKKKQKKKKKRLYSREQKELMQSTRKDEPHDDVRSQC